MVCLQAKFREIGWRFDRSCKWEGDGSSMVSMTCVHDGSSTGVAWRACRLSSHASGEPVLREGKCQVEGTGYGSPCKWGKKNRPPGLAWT